MSKRHTWGHVPLAQPLEPLGQALNLKALCRQQNWNPVASPCDGHCGHVAP